MLAATRVQTREVQLALNFVASAVLLTLAAIAGPLHAFFKGPESAGIMESPDEAAGNGNSDN
jgi:hypothetical protein